MPQLGAEQAGGDPPGRHESQAAEWRAQRRQCGHPARRLRREELDVGEPRVECHHHLSGRRDTGEHRHVQPPALIDDRTAEARADHERCTSGHHLSDLRRLVDIDCGSYTPEGKSTGYKPFHVSTGAIRGISDNPLGDQALGRAKHDAWTYWGHSGSPLFNEQGAIVALHNSWDSSTAMRHAVPHQAIVYFLDREKIAYSVGR